MKIVNKNLTQEQKDVLVNKATEIPFSGTLLHNEEDGMYSCVNCGAALFDAATKFDSGSGWPSFYDVAHTKAVRLVEDRSLGMQRIEALCAQCDGHLGHVFNDAVDQPTGIRFCINSASLSFQPEK